MIIRKETTKLIDRPLQLLEIHPDSCLFFDIETTGLSWKTSHIYLLGAIYFENGTWQKKQWFCQKPSEEKELLSDFSTLLNSRIYLFHFNGAAFDVPYLMHKYTFYQLNQSWDHLISYDFYQKLLPYKQILSLEHLRQKDLEHRMGRDREDPYSGKDLIRFYQEYLKTADTVILESLFLHNEEDILGLAAFTPFITFLQLFEGNLSSMVSDIESTSALDSCRLHLHLKYPVPVSCHISTEYFEVTMENQCCYLAVPVFFGTLKYFFSDYKNYYYLKYEDTAIHKSVGTYVDKEFRENAKANNCYQKKEGTFLPQFHPLFQPDYREHYKDNCLWFEYRQEIFTSAENQLNYASHLLAQTKQICQKKR